MDIFRKLENRLIQRNIPCRYDKKHNVLRFKLPTSGRVRGYCTVAYQNGELWFEVSFETYRDDGFPVSLQLEGMPYEKEAYAYLLMRHAFDSVTVWTIDPIERKLHTGYKVCAENVNHGIDAVLDALERTTAVADRMLQVAESGQVPDDSVGIYDAIKKAMRGG